MTASVTTLTTSIVFCECANGFNQIRHSYFRLYLISRDAIAQSLVYSAHPLPFFCRGQGSLSGPYRIPILFLVVCGNGLQLGKLQ